MNENNVSRADLLPTQEDNISELEKALQLEYNYLTPPQKKVLSDLKKQQQEFDLQYDEWQKELETWRKANANHRDPQSYQDYAQRWEEWKNKLLAQKDQMQRLYRLTLIKLKSQASEQKEQYLQSSLNVNQMSLPPQNYSVAKSQLLHSLSTHHNDQFHFNRPMNMNVPYFINQRLPSGIAPYQPRYPTNSMITPQHAYQTFNLMASPVSMIQHANLPRPAFGVPFVASGQPNIRTWNPNLSSPMMYHNLVPSQPPPPLPPPPPPPPPPSPPPPVSSAAASLRTTGKSESSSAKDTVSASNTNNIDDIVKRASQLIPGLGQYLDDDLLNKYSQSKAILPTIDLTEEEEPTTSNTTCGNETKNLAENSLPNSQRSENSAHSSASREVQNLKKANLASESDSEEDIQVEKVVSDKPGQPFDLAGVINQMKSIKPVDDMLHSKNMVELSSSNLSVTQQNLKHSQPRTLLPQAKICTEGLTTIIEPIDSFPSNGSQQISDNHQANRGPSDHHERFLKKDNASTAIKHPYTAKTIDYGHVSPLTRPTFPDDSSRQLNRFPSYSFGPRPRPQRFESGYSHSLGAMRQQPQFNQMPPTFRNPIFEPQLFNRPTMNARPYFNEGPSNRPPVRGFQSTNPAVQSQWSPRFSQVCPQPRVEKPQLISRRSETSAKDSMVGNKDFSTPKLVPLQELLYPPTRDSRPKRIVIILRGLPGSGKTRLAKMVRDKEAEYFGSAPRILSIDDYFMVEKEVVVNDETSKPVKTKEFVYEFEEAMEDTYRASLLKAFKKTTDAPYFKFIIVDAVNSLVSHFHEFHSHATSKGFTVYICEMKTQDLETSHNRNIHDRSLADVRKLAEKWEKTPNNYSQLDPESFLERIAREETDRASESSVGEKRRGSQVEEDDIIKKKLASGANPSRDEIESKEKSSKSRWEKMEESSEIEHDRLDGFKVKRKITMDEYLALPDDYEERDLQSNRKRVRWADVEERKKQQKMRNLGFVVGQNWKKVLDPANPERALNKTKYI